MAGYSSGFWEVIFTTVLDIPLHKLLLSISAGKVIASVRVGIYWLFSRVGGLLGMNSSVLRYLGISLGCPALPSYRTYSWVLLTIWKGSEFILRTGIWQSLLPQSWLRLYLRFNLLDNLYFMLKPALQLIYSWRPVLLIFTSPFFFLSQNCKVVKNLGLPTGREVSLAMIYILSPLSCFIFIYSLD